MLYKVLYKVGMTLTFKSVEQYFSVCVVYYAVQNDFNLSVCG